MRSLLKFDFNYLKKTSKLLIFPILLILIGIISPLTARYMNELLESLLGDSNVVITTTDPVMIDSYVQYLSDLYELVLYIIMFVALSVFIRDKSKGIFPLILSRPISRTKYLLSKYITFSGLIFVSLLGSYLVFTYYTYVIFDDVIILRGFYMLLMYFLYIECILASTLFAATKFKGYLTGILFTFGIYILYIILNLLEDVKPFIYFPGRVMHYAAFILIDEFVVTDLVLNIVMTFVFTIGFIVGAIITFKKQDI